MRTSSGRTAVCLLILLTIVLSVYSANLPFGIAQRIPTKTPTTRDKTGKSTTDTKTTGQSNPCPPGSVCSSGSTSGSSSNSIVSISIASTIASSTGSFCDNSTLTSTITNTGPAGSLNVYTTTTRCTSTATTTGNVAEFTATSAAQSNLSARSTVANGLGTLSPLFLIVAIAVVVILGVLAYRRRSIPRS